MALRRAADFWLGRAGFAEYGDSAVFNVVRGVSEEDRPCGTAAAASSAFSGDIAEACQDTAMIDDTSFSWKKKVENPMFFWILR